MTVYVLEEIEEDGRFLVGAFSSQDEAEKCIVGLSTESRALVLTEVELDRRRLDSKTTWYHLFSETAGWHAATPEHTWRRL